MNALSLNAILALELASAGIADPGERRGLGPYRIIRWSTKQPGFGVRHYRSGKRVYIVQARMEGVTRTVTICNAAFVSEAKALDVARRVLLRAQLGENPAEEKKRKRARPPFVKFLNLYWSRVGPTWKPSTMKTNSQYRRVYLDGAFAGKGIDEIEEADVVRWFADVADQGGPGGANRVLAILSAVMNRAEEWGQRTAGSNPCRGIRRYPGRRHQRFLTDKEMARMGALLEERRATHRYHVAAIYLLLLTGCRCSEITNLRWSEVKGQRLKLTDSKTGRRTIWLGTEARAVLDGLPRAAGEERVFPGDTRAKTVALAHFWMSLRAEAGLGKLRLHDLRHSFASRAAAMSETLPMIGKLLGHSNVGSTARYAHLDDADVISQAERIGARILAMTG